MIDSRNLNDLLPAVAAKARAFLLRCEHVGIPLLVTSTYRDAERQNALYAQGRTKPGKIVTRAKAGQSAHNYRLAFDIVPLHNGTAWWDAPETIWQQIGKIGNECGLEWGGNWPGIKKDRPHFQDLGGKTLTQWRAEAGLTT